MGERRREENIRYFEQLKEYCGMVLKGIESVPDKIGAYSDFLDAGEKALYWGDDSGVWASEYVDVHGMGAALH